MRTDNTAWKEAYDDLAQAVTELGYTKDFAAAIAKNLGWPMAMERMSAYLRYERPQKPEMIADEMLAIRSEILAWQARKAAQEDSAAYNRLLWHGLGEDES